MMQIEWLFLLVLIGAGSGAINGLISCCPMLIAITSLYLAMPFFDVSFSTALLPIIATCIAAFVPVTLYEWIRAMKNELVDYEMLISFAPGAAMGGIIGAQLMSLISLTAFISCFSIICLVACVNFTFRLNTIRLVTPKPEGLNLANKLVRLPFGLFVGTLSLLSGNSGKTLGESLFFLQACSAEKRQGTAAGLAVFISIAAVVGFAFPAVAFDKQNLAGFAGAVHFPSLMALAISHFSSYWVCQGRGSRLDKNVILVSLVAFLIVALVRIWFF